MTVGKGSELNVASTNEGVNPTDAVGIVVVPRLLVEGWPALSVAMRTVKLLVGLPILPRKTAIFETVPVAVALKD